MDALIFFGLVLAAWYGLNRLFTKWGFMEGDEELLRNDRNKKKK